MAISTLPVTQYPTIAPPAVSVVATFPGADAETVQNSVTQVIEQQLTGVDNLLYFSSSSSSNGQVQITVTFAPGTNPDIAQVQVQNKVQQALPILPQEVQQQGVVVLKSQSSFLLVVALYDVSGRYTNIDISDFISSKLQDPLSRISGVGQTQVFGSPYAMRIWLDPYKLNSYNLTPADVENAVLAQNVQVSAGELGAQPTVPGQQLDATVTAQSRLTTPEQFRNIVLVASQAGAIVRLRDVARVELGAQSYSTVSRMNGYPAAGIAIQLAPGANALTTADAVKAKAADLAATFPPGVKLAFPLDNTTFIRLSITEVIKTLVEAIFLVVIVMFLFLQHWRTTLIPAIAVPGGPAGHLRRAGGVRLFDQHAHHVRAGAGDRPSGRRRHRRGGKRRAPHARRGPVAQGGDEEIDERDHRRADRHRARPLRGVPAHGVLRRIDRRYLPAILRHHRVGDGAVRHRGAGPDAGALRHAADANPGRCHETRGRFFTWFNNTFDHGRARYQEALQRILGWVRPALLIYAGIVVVLVLLFIRLPTAFLPEEDQGTILTQITLPVGATQSRTLAGGQAGRASFHGRREGQCCDDLHRRRLQPRRFRTEFGAVLRAPETVGPAPGRQEQRAGHRAARHGQLCEIPRRPGVRTRCRPRCRSSASRPASTSKWRTAAISAMTG